MLRDGSSALKIWTRNRCGTVVGAFNVQGADWDPKTRRRTTLFAAPPAVSAAVSPCDAEDCRVDAGADVEDEEARATHAALCVVFAGPGPKVSVPICLDVATLMCFGGGGKGGGGEDGGLGERSSSGRRPASPSKVSMAGSWDGWRDRFELQPKVSVEGGAQWSASLSVVPGTFEFKFVVDGEVCELWSVGVCQSVHGAQFKI